MTITTLTRKTALTGTGVLAALALAACGTTADNGVDLRLAGGRRLLGSGEHPRHGRRLDHVSLGVVVGLVDVGLVDGRRGRQRLGYWPGR